MESIGESLISAIEKVISTREDKILECILEFQSHVIEELISIRQLLKQRCLNSVGKNKDNCTCNCQLHSGNSHTSAFFKKPFKNNFVNSYSICLNERSDYLKEESTDVFQRDVSYPRESKDSFIQNEVLEDVYPSWLKLRSASLKQHLFSATSQNANSSSHANSKVIFRDSINNDVSVFDRNESVHSSQGEIEASKINQQPIDDMLLKKNAQSSLFTIPNISLNHGDFSKVNNSLSVIDSNENKSVKRSSAKSLLFDSSNDIDDTDLLDSDSPLLKAQGLNNSRTIKNKWHSNFSLDHKKNLSEYRHFIQDGAKKQYKCSLCGKHFSSKSTVQKHAKLHNGVKPYSCKLCGKAFSEKFSLKRHLMIHTGEKPFKCTICNKSYSRKDYRDLHMKLHWDNILSKKKNKESVPMD